MPDEPDDHNNNSDQEHEQRDTVHAMHKLQAHISRLVGVALAEVKIGCHLLPDTLFHDAA